MRIVACASWCISQPATIPDTAIPAPTIIPATMPATIRPPGPPGSPGTFSQPVRKTNATPVTVQGGGKHNRHE